MSPSKPSWLNYDEDKLDRVFTTAMAAQRGTELHAFAFEAIRLGIKLPDTPKTLNMYVNDAIGYRMIPEQILYYSENCFGTADAIAYRNEELLVHDLKTGINPTSENQLLIYCALFCLEYKVNPFSIKMTLRIYQNDQIREYVGDPDEVMHIMEKIKLFDRRISELRLEAQS